MCILSRPIKDIAATHILVSDLGNGVHGTVYSMDIDTAVPVAMILPVPIKSGSGEDALQFLNLERYPNFFEDLDKLFPEPMTKSLSFGMDSMVTRSRSTLKVHDVGSFVASYVPTIHDFDRLDPQFRLDASVWGTLPDYTAFGFAVFQIKPGVKKQRIHPMAYRYPVANADEVFFPTVHVHDGNHADAEAEFDHKLYVQGSKEPNAWEQSVGDPADIVDLFRSMGLVIGGKPVHRRRIKGMLPNADTVLVAKSYWAEEVTRPVRQAPLGTATPTSSDGLDTDAFKAAGKRWHNTTYSDAELAETIAVLDRVIAYFEGRGERLVVSSLIHDKLSLDNMQRARNDRPIPLPTAQPPYVGSVPGHRG